MAAEPVNEWTDHVCTYPEVIIEEDLGALKPGDKVMAPCPVCGDTPLDAFEWVRTEAQRAETALLEAMPVRILYHWSPASRRKMINHYGLRPGSRFTTSSLASPVICFADSPSWAWALSGEQRNAPDGLWDLWQTRLDVLLDPVVLASEDRMSGLHEVRTESRVFKRDLWLVGHRTKDAAHPLRQLR